MIEVRIMKKLITVILAAAMLCACQQTPQNVKDKGHYENSGIAVSKEMISPSQLEESSQQALEENYNQIKLENIKLALPEQVEKLSFGQVSGFEESYKSVFDSVFGKGGWDAAKVAKKTSDEPEDMTTYTFSDENKQLYGCVGDNGLIAFVKPDSFADPFAAQSQTEKIIHVDRGEGTDEQYELIDGKVSVSEAKQYAEKWLNEYYRQYEPDYDFCVKTIIVRKTQNAHCYEITVQKKYKGTSLDELAMISMPDDPKHIKYSVSKITMTMHRKNEISSFTNGCGIIKPIKKGSENELLSLKSALKLCQDKFTAYNELKINAIGLKYTIEPVYEKDDKYDHAHRGRLFGSRLVWEFVMDVPHEQKLQNGQTDTFGDIRKYIYVDAQTGEIEFDFDGIIQ